MNISVADEDVRYVPAELEPTNRCAIMHNSRYRWLLGIVDVSGSSILDFGCGSGYGADYLAQRGARVLGLDISPMAIKYAKATFALPRFQVQDLTNCTLVSQISERFDVIVSFDVIEHVEKWWVFLDNVRGLLKKDGVAVIGCPNRIAHFDFNPFWNKFHVQEFTPVQLQWVCSKYFDRVEVLGQRFLDPKDRVRYTAQPMGPLWYMKEALLLTPLRTPVQKAIKLIRNGDSARPVKTRGGRKGDEKAEIVFDAIDMHDEASMRAPFGLVAVCRP